MTTFFFAFQRPLSRDLSLSRHRNFNLFSIIGLYALLHPFFQPATYFLDLMFHFCWTFSDLLWIQFFEFEILLPFFVLVFYLTYTLFSITKHHPDAQRKTSSNFISYKKTRHHQKVFFGQGLFFDLLNTTNTKRFLVHVPSWCKSWFRFNQNIISSAPNCPFGNTSVILISAWLKRGQSPRYQVPIDWRDKS